MVIKNDGVHMMRMRMIAYIDVKKCQLTKMLKINEIEHDSVFTYLLKCRSDTYIKKSNFALSHDTTMDDYQNHEWVLGDVQIYNRGHLKMNIDYWPNGLIQMVQSYDEHRMIHGLRMTQDIWGFHKQYSYFKNDVDITINLRKFGFDLQEVENDDNAKAFIKLKWG